MSGNQPNSSSALSFAEAMQGAKAGMPELNSNSAIPDSENGSNSNDNSFGSFDQSKYAEKLNQKEDPLKKARHRELFNRVSPIDQHEVFSRQQQETLAKIEQYRLQVKGEAAPIAVAQPQIKQTLTTAIERQVETGSYLLQAVDNVRQRVTKYLDQKRSAEAWQKEAQAKNMKKANMGMHNAKGSDKTELVHKTAHHEVAVQQQGA